MREIVPSILTRLDLWAFFQSLREGTCSKNKKSAKKSEKCVEKEK